MGFYLNPSLINALDAHPVQLQGSSQGAWDNINNMVSDSKMVQVRGSWIISIFFFSLLSPAHWSNTLDWKKKKKESGQWYILQVTTTVTTPKLGELIGKGELQKKRGWLTIAKTEAGNGCLYWEMIYKPWERKMDGSKTQDMLYNKVYKCPYLPPDSEDLRKKLNIMTHTERPIET